MTASLTYGHSLSYMGSQPLLHTVTASLTYGYSLSYIRLPPLLRTVTASLRLRKLAELLERQAQVAVHAHAPLGILRLLGSAERRLVVELDLLGTT